MVKAELHDLTGLHQDSQGPQMFLFSRTRLDAKSYALFRFHETDFVLAWFKSNLFVGVRRFGVTILREVWSIDTMLFAVNRPSCAVGPMNGVLGADLCRTRQIFGG